MEDTEVSMTERGVRGEREMIEFGGRTGELPLPKEPGRHEMGEPKKARVYEAELKKKILGGRLGLGRMIG